MANRVEEFDVITAIQMLRYFDKNEWSDVISKSYKALSSTDILFPLKILLLIVSRVKIFLIVGKNTGFLRAVVL